MANLIIQENGVARTRPAVTGEEITIKTPCSCSDVTGVKINGVVFPFYDAMGNPLGNTAGLFNKDSLIRVLIDADKTRAYILNADTNAYLESKLAEKYSPSNKPSLEALGAQPAGNYAEKSHVHTKSQITDFPSTMPPSAHTHTKSDITDFPSTMTPSAHNQAASTITAGTLAGQVKANATAAATVGTAQVRDIYAGTSDMTAGTSALTTGTLYFVYE